MAIVIPSFDQNLFALINGQEPFEMVNTAGSSYYDGNFKGAHRMPTTVSSDRLLKPSGTTVYDLSEHIKNDGTYIRFMLKASGGTSSAVGGDVYLIFEDPDDPLLEISLTIQDAVDAEMVDPIAFRYASHSSTSYLWSTANLFNGGRTNSKNYPYFYIFIRPYAEYKLKKISVYSNKAYNTGYDGFLIAQTDVYKVVTQLDFYETGHAIYGPFDISSMNIPVEVKYAGNVPEGTSVRIYTAFTNDNSIVGTVWAEQPESGGAANWPQDNYGEFLWIKIVMSTDDVLISPTITDIWLDEGYNPANRITVELSHANKLRYPQGDVGVSFHGSMTGILNSFVDPFIETFTPENITPLFNPHSDAYLTVAASVLNTANLLEVIKSEVQETDFEALTVIGAAVNSAVLTHIDDLET